MTTALQNEPILKTSNAGLQPYRLNVAQFEAMIDAGVFPPETRLELLGGLLAEKMTRNPPHTFVVDELDDRLRTLVAPGWIVRKEHPLILADDWQPEPDLALVRGPRDRYRATHPRSGDVALIVEVSDSTYPLDRGAKWEGYAAAGVPCYWIVHLESRSVEVYSHPEMVENHGLYRNRLEFREADSVPVVIEGTEIGRVVVNEILA